VNERQPSTGQMPTRGQGALHRSLAAIVIYATLLVVAGSGSFFLSSQRLAAFRSDLALWEDAALDQPHNAVVQNNIGAALQKLDRWDEARGRFEAAVALDPGYVDAYVNLGCTLDKLGDLSGAVAQFRAALVVNPDSRSAHNNLGIALARVGNRAEGREHLARAVALDPTYALARYNLAILLSAAGQNEQAIEHLLILTRQTPDDPDVQARLGELLARRGPGGSSGR
jgi:protein O-GlcNAc transferase